MSAERSAPSEWAASTLAIYLAAFTVPGLGSTLAWACARVWTRDPALARHHRRALTIQLACLLGMGLVQAGVLGALWAGFPGPGPVELRRVLLLAGLYATAGLYLTMGLLGPILLLAERARRTSRPGRARASPPSPVVSTRRVRPG